MSMAALKQWWHGREPRERHVLAVGAVACALMLGWGLVWHPLARAQQDLGVRLDARQQDLAFMQSAAAQLQASPARDRSSEARRQGKSLLALANDSANKAGLGPNIKRLNPLDQHRIRIEYRAANFDVLAAWLTELHGQYGIRVDELSISRASGPGEVDAHLTLSEP